jgi:hypothetical protein
MDEKEAEKRNATIRARVGSGVAQWRWRRRRSLPQALPGGGDDYDFTKDNSGNLTRKLWALCVSVS